MGTTGTVTEPEVEGQIGVEELEQNPSPKGTRLPVEIAHH